MPLIRRRSKLTLEHKRLILQLNTQTNEHKDLIVEFNGTFKRSENVAFKIYLNLHLIISIYIT